MSAPELVYDGSCPLCVSASRRLVRWGWLEEEKRRAFQSLPGDLQARLIEAGFRNALAVLDGERILLGPEGLWRLREEAHGSGSAALLGWAPLRWLATRVYGVIAPNRRILAPVPGTTRVACACEPEPTREDRRRLIVPAVVLTLLFALVVGGLGGRPGLGLAAGSLAAFGALLLAALPPGRRLARMAHAAWIVLVGAGAALVAALLLAVVDQGIPLSGVARLAVTASVFVFVAGAATMRRIALARR